MKQMIDTIVQSYKAPFKLVCRLLLLPLILSCDKQPSPVPTARFTVTINLNLPDYNKNAFVVNRYYGKNVGVSGVLVVRGTTNNGTDGYNVFERYCPYDKNISTRVEFDDDNFTATCPECQSQFLIATPDGDVLKGPAKHPLKTYKTRLEGRQLTIYN